MFRSILIIFRELFNIKESYIKNMAGLLSTLIFVHKMSVDIINFVVAVQNWYVGCAGCRGVTSLRPSPMVGAESTL